jgi:hypothetical protein
MAYRYNMLEYTWFLNFVYKVKCAIWIMYIVFFFLSNTYKYLNNTLLQMQAFINDCIDLLYNTGCLYIIGGFRYSITWVGSVTRSWNSCRLHTLNKHFEWSYCQLAVKSVNQCWKEMASSQTERSWCVLEFARCNIFVAVQCAWGAHRVHLKSLWNCKHSSFKW